MQSQPSKPAVLCSSLVKSSSLYPHEQTDLTFRSHLYIQDSTSANVIFDSLTAIAFEAAQLLLSACVHAECSHPSCWKKNKYVSSFIASVLINSTRNNEAGIVLGAHVRSSIRHQLKCSPLGFLSKKHISPNYNKWQLSLLHWPSLATARRWGRRRKEKPALCPCMGFHFYCVWLLFL